MFHIIRESYYASSNCSNSDFKHIAKNTLSEYIFSQIVPHLNKN